MKKFLSLILCLLLACCLLTACGGKNTANLDLTDIVATVESVAPVAMSQELSPAIEGSDAFMTDLKITTARPPWSM